MCLIPDTIASEPLCSWHDKGKPHSKAALEWLYWKEHELGQSDPDSGDMEDRIAHAGNRGERMIAIGPRKVYVDGFDGSTRTVYEFLGDFYHGCPVTFLDRCMRHPKHDYKTMQNVYETTLERLKAIEQAGYNVEVIWEHEWNQMKREREDVKEFVNALTVVGRLEPREACNL